MNDKVKRVKDIKVMDGIVKRVKDIKVLKIEVIKGCDLRTLLVTYKERGKKKEEFCVVDADRLEGDNKFLDEGLYNIVELSLEYIEGMLYSECISRIYYYEEGKRALYEQKSKIPVS